jgi:hypothetical protein
LAYCHNGTGLGIALIGIYIAMALHWLDIVIGTAKAKAKANAKCNARGSRSCILC